MRKHTIVIATLLLLQFVSAIAFVPFVSHLMRIWENHGIGWWNAFKAEYAQSGGIMAIEIIVVVGAVLATLVFEAWLLVDSIKGEKELKKQLDRIEKKLGGNGNDG